MSNKALMQQLEHTVETPTAPSPADGAAKTEASGDLCSAVARWLDAECTVHLAVHHQRPRPVARVQHLERG
jgi:hypothetical protein